jgi:hypothetical protein
MMLIVNVPIERGGTGIYEKGLVVPHHRHPGAGRDPLLPWAPAFAGVVGDWEICETPPSVRIHSHDAAERKTRRSISLHRRTPVPTGAVDPGFRRESEDRGTVESSEWF